jgi:uncharacterized protein YggU (UPF0235/DUF167 family)
MKLKIRVKIGKRGEVLGWDGDTLHVGVNAAPIEGASNRRLIEILSDWLKVNKSSIYIVKGLTNRYKTLDIDVEAEYLNEKVAELPRIAKQDSLF